MKRIIQIVIIFLLPILTKAEGETAVGIRKIDWNGIEAVEFFAGGYKALMIPSMGANLISLINEGKNIDILHSPKSGEIEVFIKRPQIFGLPLLFPPNRIEDGTYTFEGRKYQFPITIPSQNNHHHGIIKSQKFTINKAVVGKNHVEVEAVFFSNAVNNQIYKNFPHEFECRMNFKLSIEGLEHKITFINQGERNMPLGVGYHTTINIPFVEGTNKDDYKLVMSVGKRWELNSRLLPTETLLDLTREEALLRTSGVNPVGTDISMSLTNEPLKVNGKKYSGAILTHEPSGTKVFYEVDKEIKHWVLWNNGGNAGYVCPEPQTWAVNAPNLKMDKSITGFQSLAPKKSWSMTSKLYVK